jgi:hypothetical protein
MLWCPWWCAIVHAVVRIAGRVSNRGWFSGGAAPSLWSHWVTSGANGNITGWSFCVIGGFLHDLAARGGCNGFATVEALAIGVVRFTVFAAVYRVRQVVPGVETRAECRLRQFGGGFLLLITRETRGGLFIWILF